MSSERQIFTLKQVAQSIQKIIADRYQNAYWVQAEVHKLNYTTKGHCYPELVQKEDEKIVVDMRGTIWKSNFDTISRKFAEVVKEPLRDGMNLLLLVKISFHPLYGMGLEIIDIDPTYSLGELEKERKETLLRLQKEGLLNANQQLSFPLLPKRIAIISVDSSKGLSDFYSVINNNQWSYRFFTMLFEAQLNGDAAIKAIQNQLERIKKVKQHFDVVLIIRGGGGEIGMSCYNNYFLAKAIATFPLPVLTGIGHSTNTTVSELVAYRNAITPTELAEMLIQSFHNFSVPLETIKKSLFKESSYVLEKNKIELRNSLRFISSVSLYFIVKTQQEFKLLAFEMKQHSQQYIRQQVFTIKQVKEKLTTTYQNLMYQDKRLLLEQLQQLKLKTENRLNLERREIQFFTKTIELVDPTRVLKRGYSITMKNGKLISAENPILAGDTIQTTTFDMQIESEVISRKKITS
jgi:exodeoxyribonuclease VII large subunit